MPFLREFADIRVFCPRAVYPPLRFLQPRRFLHRPASNGYDVAGLDAGHYRFRTLPVIGRALNGYLSGRAVFEAVRSYSPDIILAYMVYPDGYGAVRIGRRLNVPVVLFAIGSDVRYIADAVQERLVRSALRRAVYVLAVSHELRERAIALGASPETSRAILNGCNTQTFRPKDRQTTRSRLGLDAHTEQIVFVGRLVPLKGLRELFEAVALVRRTHSALELTCIGEGPLAAELAERASRDDLKGAIRFLPSASPDEVSDWMAAANITCLPSYSEGCPNVVVESLACGRAVVATEVGGVPELLNASNGIMVPAHDSQALARGLDEALRRTWDEQAIARSAQRSWRDVARETIDICREVLASRQGAATTKDARPR